MENRYDIYINKMYELYRGCPPMILAGDLSELRISAPQYFIQHLSPGYFNVVTTNSAPGKTKCFGIEVIPAYENKLTIFHTKAALFPDNEKLKFQLNL